MTVWSLCADGLRVNYGSSPATSASAASSLSARPCCTSACACSGPNAAHAAASTRTTQLIEDVHAFPGHIACDSASNSELVVPLVKDGHMIGVLDLDSPVRARFDVEDQAGVEEIARLFLEALG